MSCYYENTVEPLNADTLQIWTLFSPNCGNSAPEIRTVIWVSVVSAVKGFHCIILYNVHNNYECGCIVYVQFVIQIVSSCDNNLRL